MEWTADVAAGDWLRERLDDGGAWGASMHGVVPRGFAGYARILHRPDVSWVEGRAYPTQDELRETDPADWPETRRAQTTWAEAARAFGTALHPAAQWNAIVRRHGDTPEAVGDWQHVVAPDGREYGAPQEGFLDADVLSAVAQHLAAHTTTPDDGFVALWEGWGGLLGFFGETPSRTFLTFAGDDAAATEHHNEMLARSIHDPFNSILGRRQWQPGILDDAASKGDRLELPGRGHVLFRGGASELADPEWVLNVPWRDLEAEGHGFEPQAQSPSLVWPDDHAWVLVTEVDYDSTIVAGSRGLVAAIVADPRLEALEIPEGARLTWDADEVNG